jgi:hypothetical protein
MKNTSFYFNPNSSLAQSLTQADLQKNVATLQAAVASGVVVNLFKGKIILSAGINLDYNDPYIIALANNNNLLITPDFTAQWLLNKDGTVRLVGFNKTNVDINGQRNRTGLKLSFQRDFN